MTISEVVPTSPALGWAVPENVSLPAGLALGATTIHRALLNTGWSGAATLAPAPARAVRGRVSEILRLTSEEGWNSYGASPVGAVWGAAAGEWLAELAAVASVVPVIAPTPAGGLAATWEASRGAVEVVLSPRARHG